MILSKVLVIDDDPSIRKIAEISLSLIGKLNVSTASSADEGLRKVVEDRPDLILLDVHMPEKSGLEALIELKSNPALAGIPVVMMTASYNDEQIELYESKGAGMVIMKPFQTLELPDQLKKFAADL